MEVEDLTLISSSGRRISGTYSRPELLPTFTTSGNSSPTQTGISRDRPKIRIRRTGELRPCLWELNGVLPPESVQIAYRSEHPVVPPAVSVNNTTPLPTVGPDYEDPEIATLVQEIIAEKTTSKARKEVRWTEKTRGEFESKFKFILRYFGEGRKVSEITKENLTELMDIFNTRLSARRDKRWRILTPMNFSGKRDPKNRLPTPRWKNGPPR
jgi:hypothetical protein